MDLLEWTICAISASNLVLLTLLWLGIRQFSKLFSNIPAIFSQFLQGMLWEESVEEAEDGTKVVTRKPSAQLVGAIQAVVPVVAPVLMKEGMEWAKKNIKLNPSSIIGAAGGGGGGLGGLGALVGQMLPKQYQKFVPILGPILERFIPGLGGNPTAPGGTAPNPYANAYGRKP